MLTPMPPVALDDLGMSTFAELAPWHLHDERPRGRRVDGARRSGDRELNLAAIDVNLRVGLLLLVLLELWGSAGFRILRTALKRSPVSSKRRVVDMCGTKGLCAGQVGAISRSHWLEPARGGSTK